MIRQPLRRIRESFSGKIIALVVASVVATSFVVGLATTRGTRAFLTERTSEKFPSTLANTQSRVKIWYERQYRDLDGLGESSVFRSNLARVLGGNGERRTRALAEVEKYLLLVHEKFPVFSRLCVLTRNGQVVAGAVGEAFEVGDAVRFLDDPAVASRTTPVRFADDYSGAHQWILVSVDIDEKQKVWMTARLDLSELASLLGGVAVGTSGDLYLLDDQGRFLTRPRGTLDDVVGTVAMQVPTRQTGAPAVETRENHAGRRVFHSKVHLAEFGWWLVYDEDYRDAMTPVLGAQRRIWVAVFVLGGFAVLAAIRVVHSILRPIHDLAVGARRINEGLVGVKIPVSGQDEVAFMINTFNEMARKIALSQAELQYKNKMLQTKTDELEAMNLRLEELSITDGLTSLFNHRHFWNLLNTELSRVDLYQGDLALVLVDLDDFKRVNDQFGHSVGDLLLQAVARLLKETMRETDIVARYGGEEFAILLPDTDRAGVESVCEKLRESVAAARFTVPDTDIALRVTASIGVSVFRGNRRDFFNAADKALYHSKADGKNRVHFALT
jgi:diguanylate cyclase (GGDEF)-like protein